ncbi:MAG: hypothetical protein IJC16_02020 [Rikenellaceae bacterium]|nr:hypothetical protein [Rikenellaceae bacterium]
MHTTLHTAAPGLPLRRLFRVLGLLVLVACGDKESGGPAADPEVTAPAEVVFPAATQDTTIRITANLPWSLSGATGGALVYNPRSGGAGTTPVTVSMAGNSSASSELRVTLNLACGSLIQPIDFVRAPRARLTFTRHAITDIARGGEQIAIEVQANGTYEVSVPQPFRTWISEVPAPPDARSALRRESVTLLIDANPDDMPRRGQVVIHSAGLGLSDTATIWQDGATSIDGYVSIWQQSTHNPPVKIVIMGDGFNKDDITSGKYERALSEAAGYLFAIEPYKSYRDYFTVYFVWAVSNESGIAGDRVKDTKFRSLGLDPDIDICWEYVRKAPIDDDTGGTAVMLVLNATWYGGRTTFWSDGAAIARVPMSREPYPWDFRGLVQHEMGGHAIAKLHDEYPIPDILTPQAIADVRWWQSIGFYGNVDFTNDPAQVLWKHFIGREGYPMVGVYEGAFWQSGAYRAEEDQCMIYNIPYYNAPSRELIVRRIRSLAGEPYSFEEFLRNDKIEPPVKSAWRYEPAATQPADPGQLPPQAIDGPPPGSPR